MDTEFIYHETIRQSSGRRRAKSLLQNIASQNPPAPTSPEERIEPKVVVHIPAEAEVPRRRAHSLSHNTHREPLSKEYTITPLTRIESANLREQALSLRDGDDEDEFDDDDDDEVDEANLYKYAAYQNTANFYSRSCTKLLTQSKNITQLLAELNDGFLKVKLDAAEFENACNELISDHDKFSNLLTNVDSNLLLFAKLERATRMLHAPGSDLVTKSTFKPLLQDLDEGLEYVEKHRTFKDIDLYQMRYRQCMTRALQLSQTFFNTQIRNITSHIQQQISAKMLNSTTQTALLYSRFENESGRLRPLTEEIALRFESHREYYGLFSECLKTYFTARQRLLGPIIPKTFEESSNQNIVQFLRYCLNFYRQLCHDERRLFDKFFNAGYHECDEWLTTLCDPLYDALRQRIIRETDINNLSEMTSILLGYQGEENIDPEQTLVDYAVMFRPILEDVQSRLVFRVQSIVDQDIVKYMPKPEDLSLGHRRESNAGKRDSISATFDTEQLLQGWYPPMQRTILLLSQIYQLVNSAVFDDLAHRILHECLVSLETVHALALARLGPTEGELLLIKHLLILSQQISGFDIESIPAETSIDFSGLQESFAKVRQEGVSFSGSNLLNLARESVPRVVNNMLDAKAELYVKLRNAITEFTEAAVKSIVKAIIDNPEPKDALEATRKLRQDAAEALPHIRKTIGSYIEDERTIHILIDSIQDLVVQTYEGYSEQVLAKCDSPDQLDGLMEVDGMISWLGDIVGKLHA